MTSTGAESTLPNPGADPGESRRAAWLVVICCAIYFTSYLTRKGYDASILAICESTGLARKAAGLASTAAVALYGSGQFVTGILADRFDPRKIIFLALLITASCNATMPFAAGAACVPAMVALWAVNGFSQAMFWPPLVKIVADNLSQKAFKGAVFWISMASNAAIIAVFLLVSGCIRFADWHLSFAIVSTAAIAMAAVWAAAARRLAPAGSCASAKSAPQAGKPADTQGGCRGMWRLLSASGLFAVMAAIVMQGIMRDGIEVWASSIVKDQYGLDTSGSIFSVALLPVFAAASMVAARAIRRALGDEIKGAAFLFAVAFACAAVLFATNGATIAVGLPLLALISASMCGANLLMIGELPGRFVRHGRIGTISGLLNAFTYVGAAISIYGFAALHERFNGWRPVFGIWIAVLAAAIVLCFLALRKWLRFQKS